MVGVPRTVSKPTVGFNKGRVSSLSGICGKPAQGLNKDSSRVSASPRSSVSGGSTCTIAVGEPDCLRKTAVSTQDEPGMQHGEHMTEAGN